MLKFIFKKNGIFKVKKEKEVEGAEVWMVSWDSRCGKNGYYTQKVAKAFLLKQDAIDFAQSLYDAHALLQNTNDIHINIEKQE